MNVKQNEYILMGFFYLGFTTLLSIELYISLLLTSSITKSWWADYLTNKQIAEAPNGYVLKSAPATFPRHLALT